MKITRFALTAILWIGLLEATRAAVLTYYVATNGSHGTFTTWATAATNIQAAVNVSVDDDIIWVTNGTYYCGSNADSMVTVTKRITIQSVNGPGVTIVDANFPSFTNRCFYITATGTVSGFTITNGHVETLGGAGGGVYINLGGLLTNCIVTGNTMTNAPKSGSRQGGGGIYLEKGGTVKNCLIAFNTATNYGGGLMTDWDSAGGTYTGSGLVVEACTISNNSVIGTGGGIVLFCAGLATNCTIIGNRADPGSGGGISISLGIATTCRIGMNYAKNDGGGAEVGSGALINSSIYGNITGSRGSGVKLDSGLVSNCNIYCNTNPAGSSGGGGVYMGGDRTPITSLIQDCFISNNWAVNYGGLYIWGGGGVRNCLITYNYASGSGGGLGLVARYSATQMVMNCTIVSNKAATSGGGILVDSSTYGGTLMMVNSIMASNTATTGPNWWTNSPSLGSYSISNCCVTPTNGLVGANNISNAPVFVDFAAGNFRLSQVSPCINAGINLDWMINAVDLDGHRRLDGFSGRPDMGCYEFVPAGTMFRVR